jgi:transcriptional regulator with XRE-family HTH domain
LDKEVIFADNFKKYRKKKGISQKEFAQKLYEIAGKQLTLTSISNYETGLYMPPAQVLPAIADILKVSIDALFETEETTAVIDKKEVVPQGELEQWKRKLESAEKELYFLKTNQDTLVLERAMPVIGCCKKLLEVARKQQDELLVLQTELTTIREMFTLLKG